MRLIRTQDGGETRDSAQACTSAEIKYSVFDITTKDAGFDAVFADRPLYYKSLPFKEVRFDGYDGNGNAEFTVVYAKSDNAGTTIEDGQTTFNFDCSGGTKHVVHALAQRCVYGNIDAGGAVGWNGKTGINSEIRGIDVPTGQMRKTWTKAMRTSRLTTSFERRVNSCVGKINSRKFKGWERGEVMFLGASYSAPDSGNNVVLVSFNFAIQENENSAEVNGIKCGKKLGWEAIHSIDKTVSDENGRPASEITAIHISQVAQFADFSVLGL